ncbi:glycoside hydrolase family 3 N-terminal domain-containing protein [Mycolicibacterium sp. XJ2]
MTDPMTRAHDLLCQMTVDEKAMQLSSVFPLALFTPEGITRSRLDALLGNGIGHVCALGLIGHKAPEVLAKVTNAIQRYLVTETRLKIPAIFHNEAMSGVVAPGFTAFPTPIAMAATWDTEAVEEMARLIRRQLRSVGLCHALGPVMDIARDARWGRISETFGEDAYLVSAMSVAYTQGLQSHDLVHGVAATGKHFIGYAVTEGGQNMAATAIGARELYDVYARPFEAAIRLAGLASVMPSYSEFDGVPVSASHAVLTALLRDKLGFTGTTVSDYVAVGFLQTRQRVAETAEDAGVLALVAGMDVETPEVFGYGEVLANAVRNGRVAESVLDRSVLRVLRDKFALGLFDNPYVPEDPIVINTVASEGADLSARLAGRAVTLLKNDGDLLPLSRDLVRVAVIGPHADDVAAGFSTYTFADAVKMFEVRATGGEIAMAGMELGGEVPHEALMAIAGELGPVFATDRSAYIESNYSAVSLADAVRELLPHAEVLAVAGTGVTPTEPVDIGAAIAAAGDADAVILAVGGRSSWSGQRTEGEGSDTADIALPAQQVALIEAVSMLGKPTVTVLSMGRPYALDGLIDELPAVLTAYYAGPYQATAIADAVFGITNPAGKLPFTMPRHVGQVPIHHAQKTGSGDRRTDADPHSGYLDMAATPLFGFGHGLSYTTFAYGPLELASDTVDAGGAVTAAVAITNSGQRRGSDVVQLYAADTATGVTLPAQQLVGFTRVDLEPGASKSVTFTLPLSVLAYTGVSGELVVESGPVELSAGTSSTDIRARATVTVTGETRTFSGDERAFFSSVAVGA